MAEENLTSQSQRRRRSRLDGELLRDAGDRPQAVKYLQEALNLKSDIPEYLAIAAIVHNQFGERERPSGG